MKFKKPNRDLKHILATKRKGLRGFFCEMDYIFKEADRLAPS
jgi:hypothetical protein